MNCVDIPHLFPLSSVSDRNNCERDAVIVGLVNSATSLYASISVFSILGFRATAAFNSCLDRYVCKNILCKSCTLSLVNTNKADIFESHLQEHLESDQPL